ncbi:MAG: hypothetical protein P8Y78_11555 [Acidihalobacter sp.]|jgi:hypothetical protein
MMISTTRSFIAALAFMAAPLAVHAESAGGVGSVDSSLTWNVVQLSKSVAQEFPRDSSRSWFKPLKRKPTARMGLYLAPAYTPPRSVVGWESQQDIASRVRYGIYLINRF